MPTRLYEIARRNVLRLGAAGLAGAAGLGGPGRAAAQGTSPALPGPTPVDTGRVQAHAVEFPAWTAPSERPSGGPPTPLPPGERVGFAIVGLGRLALENILPAFAEAKQARLVALVSGSPEKARAVAAQYGVPPASVYDYAGFDRIAEHPEVDVVYVVLPNGLHREYVLRAAAAGKHVLCEKPMAVSSAECEDMIAACKQARRLLMIAYRCQYEPYNRDVLGLVRSQATSGRPASLTPSTSRRWATHASGGSRRRWPAGVRCRMWGCIA